MLHSDGPLSAFSAPDPLLDPARLATLNELGLLDSQPQDSVSTINRIASRVLGVPISALSLISWDRQVTIGESGLLADDEPGGAVLDAPLSHSFCQHVVRSGKTFSVENSLENDLVRNNGAVRDGGIMAYLGVPIRMSDGQTVGAFCACDTSPRRWTEADQDLLKDLARVAVDVLELHRMKRADGGLHDALTGLPRRALFQERVTQMIHRTQAAEDEQVTVVAVDLRAFRLFNEAWGHAAGDEILTEVADRFTAAMGGAEGVCRLAGDEFLIADCGLEDPDELVRRLDKMLTNPPIEIAGVEQPMSALFVPVRSAKGVDATELVDDALASLSATKASVGGLAEGAAAPSPAMARLQIRNAIGGAERRSELSLSYQPLYDLGTGRITSLEALLRWEHPQLGVVSPADFVPVAESTGAIVPIGEWVLRKACRDVATWRGRHPASNLSVAVNVAPEQVRAHGFDEIVASALACANVPSSALSLEITERTLLKDRSGERNTIMALQARGVDFHLDDFGTGYSSLGYLTRFPLDVIKIDRMFVSDLGRDASATALVEGIINVAHSLGLETVAEGIETAGQRDLLAGMGCDHGQGYFLGRPCPSEEVPELLLALDA